MSSCNCCSSIRLCCCLNWLCTCCRRVDENDESSRLISPDKENSGSTSEHDNKKTREEKLKGDESNKSDSNIQNNRNKNTLAQNNTNSNNSHIEIENDKSMHYETERAVFNPTDYTEFEKPANIGTKTNYLKTSPDELEHQSPEYLSHVDVGGANSEVSTGDRVGGNNMTLSDTNTAFTSPVAKIIDHVPNPTNLKPSERRTKNKIANENFNELKGDEPKSESFPGRGPLPPTWSKNNSMFRIVKLEPSDKEFRLVMSSFQQSISVSSRTIIQIERIENEALYNCYASKHKEILNEMGSSATVAERTLWHGTTVKEAFTDHYPMPIASINKNGFNRSYSGLSTGAVYGNGVYFAVDASTSAKYCSPDTNGRCYMYCCQVLTGNYTTGQNGMVEPPTKDLDTHNLYHSVVDNIESPSMFVIFNDYQAYPQYLITFN